MSLVVLFVLVFSETSIYNFGTNFGMQRCFTLYRRKSEKNVRSDPRKLWMLAKISSKTKASGITEADTENESA